MDAGEILDTGFRLWWRTLKQVAPYSFLMALPLQIILAIVTLLSRNANENPDTFLDNPDQRNAVIGGGVITVMLGLLIPIILQGALTAFFTDRMLGRDTPIRPCLTVGLKRVFPLIGVAILSGFMSALGCLALCVGFFFFVTKVGVSAPACVVERAGPLKSISRSWSLTDGRFWPVFGIVMFNLIVPAMFSQAISLAGLGALSLISEDAGIVGSLIGSTFAQAIVAPLTTAIIVVQYLELRVRKEGLDLQLAAQGLTVAQ